MTPYPELDREADAAAAKRNPRTWTDRLLRSEVHRLKVIRRSWIRGLRDYEHVRKVRRWMRPLLREQRRRERGATTKTGSAS